MNKFNGFIYFIFCLSTAIIGNKIHGSAFWTVFDFFFPPLAWLKWVIYHQVNLTVIHQAFDWFFK